MPPKQGEKKRTRVSSSDEEKSSHVLVDDAILKDLQAKLDKLNVLDQINERLIRIENDISTIKGKVAQLEDGLNYTNSELAEMKGKLEEKAEKDLLKDLEREVEDLRNSIWYFTTFRRRPKVKTVQLSLKDLSTLTWA